MYRITETFPGGAVAPPATADNVQALDRSLLDRHSPAAHYSLTQDGHLLARCSIWSQSTPKYLNGSVGVIGHYAADGDAGAALLRHACEQLARRGLSRVVGPMDGNTWRRYRLLTLRGNEPPFFLEPDNPDDWPSHFVAAGFVPLARYFSALSSDLSIVDPRAPDALARLRAAGIAIRLIDTLRLEEELTAVHELSLEAFAGNFLYTPIARAEFLAMYTPLRQHLRPEFILLAEEGAKLVGFIFGVPDLAQAQRGQAINTVIAKSMAVRPGRTSAGLGSVLMDMFQQAARRLNYARVIHALMHETNRSRKISSRFGQPFRQYTLYSKGIDT